MPRSICLVRAYPRFPRGCTLLMSHVRPVIFVKTSLKSIANFNGFPADQEQTSWQYHLHWLGLIRGWCQRHCSAGRLKNEAVSNHGGPHLSRRAKLIAFSEMRTSRHPASFGLRCPRCLQSYRAFVLAHGRRFRHARRRPASLTFVNAICRLPLGVLDGIPHGQLERNDPATKNNILLIFVSVHIMVHLQQYQQGDEHHGIPMPPGVCASARILAHSGAIIMPTIVPVPRFPRAPSSKP